MVPRDNPVVTYQPVLVLSVPGSGTHFTCYWLNKALGWEDINYRQAWDRLPFPASFQAHSFLDDIAKFPGYRAIVPLRAPNDTYVTRAHHASSRNIAMKRCVEAWSGLIEHWRIFDTVFLPIDTLDRRYTIEKVLKHIDGEVVDAEVHEEVINAWGKRNSEADRRGPNQTDDYRELDFANAWYRKIMRQYEKERRKE